MSRPFSDNPMLSGLWAPWPMEGDAHAAAVFWRLGVNTRGSFLTPARDWP